MRRAVPLLLLLLAGCDRSPAGDKSGQPIAPPDQSLALQPIGFPDIEANDLYGASCAYASGKSMAPLVIAFDDEAVIKVDGQIQRFKLDPQCTEVKLGTGSRYLADRQVLDLAIEGEGKQVGYETVNYAGSVKLSTAGGRVLYQTRGAVQCGS